MNDRVATVERAATVDDRTMAFGLLMESAQAHQNLAESQLERLRDHTRSLDGVVRDEIRRTLVDELRALTEATSSAIRTLKILKRGAGWRTALGSLALTAACAVVSIGTAKLALPTAKEVAALQVQRDDLTLKISSLERRGARIDLRQCGPSLRLCVRVDTKAPRFGNEADYYVLRGY